MVRARRLSGNNQAETERFDLCLSWFRREKNLKMFVSYFCPPLYGQSTSEKIQLELSENISSYPQEAILYSVVVVIVSENWFSSTVLGEWR